MQKPDTSFELSIGLLFFPKEMPLDELSLQLSHKPYKELGRNSGKHRKLVGVSTPFFRTTFKWTRFKYYFLSSRATYKPGSAGIAEEKAVTLIKHL